MKMPPQIWITCEKVAYMVIELRGGGQHLILASPEDVGELSKYRWGMHHTGAVFTTDVSDGAVQMPMHRLVSPPPDGKTVDHINRNRKDNRRENLRICTQMQNTWNTGLRPNTAVPFKGVSLRKEKTSNPYRVSIRCAGKKYEVGNFDCPEEAARAYDAKAVELFGEFAKTNEDLGLFERRFGRILDSAGRLRI